MNDEIMSCPQIKESDLHYLGGVCDVWGSVRVEGQNTKCPLSANRLQEPLSRHARGHSKGVRRFRKPARTAHCAVEKSSSSSLFASV